MTFKETKTEVVFLNKYRQEAKYVWVYKIDPIETIWLVTKTISAKTSFESNLKFCNIFKNKDCRS